MRVARPYKMNRRRIAALYCSFPQLSVRNPAAAAKADDRAAAWRESHHSCRPTCVPFTAIVSAVAAAAALDAWSGND